MWFFCVVQLQLTDFRWTKSFLCVATTLVLVCIGFCGQDLPLWDGSGRRVGGRGEKSFPNAAQKNLSPSQCRCRNCLINSKGLLEKASNEIPQDKVVFFISSIVAWRFPAFHIIKITPNSSKNSNKKCWK